ncbi:protein TRANSPARENT TESTA 9 isoform X3 [Populus trichocarpa]|uniref:protein TRANSPARENT TESTA 9 isoform X3 n=1 Tax=Populus trichocarpa TaxID=3694 RepID=UPI000D18A34A|nr:protein TRANSPARENT TESTA 9 isoform X3 [Populus trichocarpa]|eukprot:XP_024446441.1 protein TRANSPARENT TESTA 9 isoform X3 [Populus trichocarpa]
MWSSFWRSRDRFSLDELRYLIDQLQKVQIVNDVNKDFVIEALRSISELITYGDQHDSNYFEFFMERQVMGEFVRILKVSRTVSVSRQLLQTMSIMIQNLKSEHAIYYLFSNEHINFLITYAFDFKNEELLSYYISFLRAISVKLDKNTISLFVKTQNEEVVSFPLYVEAIRFAFHEENMIRTAVRALALNVYHVGDESVNRFVVKAPRADYFSNLLTYFRKQCIDLNGLVSETLKNPDSDTTTAILAAVDEIEDDLYYISDVISAGIPDVGRLITDKIMQLLILPLLLPSLQLDAANDIQIGAITSLYLLCCILRIVKIKDLANTIAAALFCSPEAFIADSETKLNGYVPDHVHEIQQPENENVIEVNGCSKQIMQSLSSSSQVRTEDIISKGVSHSTLRDALLSYITVGDDLQVLGSLSMLATLLQTKDEIMLDALGILPQRKQHKKLLLQALVGEDSREDQLFSLGSSSIRDEFNCELDGYLQTLKDQYGVACSSLEVGTTPSAHRFQVLHTLVSLFCRSNISPETLWDGGWLFRQLLPYSEAEFNSQHLKLLKTSHTQDSYKNCTCALLEETRGTWPDLLVSILRDEWKKCKRAMEASSPPKEPKCILFPLEKSSADDVLPSESSIIAGEKMCKVVKVFVLLHQLHIFSLGRALPDQPPTCLPSDIPENSRARTAGLDASGPKLGAELRLVDAVPCRIAFERGKERHFCFLAISVGTSGWILLAEELPLKKHYGIIRIVAPLAGSNPAIDEKHSRWLHLRIRPSTLPVLDPAKSITHGKAKTKALVDGRWTLAFRDDESCKTALSMIIEEFDLQSSEVKRRLNSLLNIEGGIDVPDSSLHPSEASSSTQTPSNSS